eukprot:m51a1_g1591 hypoxanthine phosphoribosyltransferase, putative (191) ;mRNA; r:148870-149882
MADIPKVALTADALLLASFQLARKVLDSGFRPNYLVGIWRGGAPVGIAVQEFLSYHGVKCDHIPIRTSSYKGIGEQGEVSVHGISYLVEKANAEDSVLLVDDIFDTGRSCLAVLEHLKMHMKRNLPQDIRIAVPWYKPTKNLTNIKPDYWIHETADWVVFPHECEGLGKEELTKLKGKEIAGLFEERKFN